MMTRIYDIAYEIDGDQINIEQDNGCGEVNYISLQRIHLAHLAEQLNILADPAGEKTIRKLARRLRVLAERIRRAVDVVGDYDSLIDDDLPSAEQSEIWYLSDLAQDFIADLDDAPQSAPVLPGRTQEEPKRSASRAQTETGQLPLIDGGRT